MQADYIVRWRPKTNMVAELPLNAIAVFDEAKTMASGK